MYVTDTPIPTKHELCAGHGRILVDAYSCRGDYPVGDEQTLVSDVIADLMRYAKSVGVDVGEVLDSARDYYHAELVVHPCGCL